MSGRWQLQDAKQQFSKVVDLAMTEGPQVVTRHGKEVAVVLSVDEYRRLHADEAAAFKRYLLSSPYFDDLELERSDELAPVVELGE